MNDYVDSESGSKITVSTIMASILRILCFIVFSPVLISLIVLAVSVALCALGGFAYGMYLGYTLLTNTFPLFQVNDAQFKFMLGITLLISGLSLVLFTLFINFGMRLVAKMIRGIISLFRFAFMKNKEVEEY